MMRRLAIRIAGVVWMLCLGVSLAPAGAEQLSSRELKKAVKQAGSAFDAGRYDQASELYEKILGSTTGTDARRGEALYALAMIRLSADAGHQDVAAARQHLDQLEAFPRHPEQLAINALKSLFSDLGTARAESERQAAELEQQAAAHQAEREQAAAEAEQAAGESEAAGGRVRTLESQLRKARSDLNACQGELETKEQALQKLRDALVGGG